MKREGLFEIRFVDNEADYLYNFDEYPFYLVYGSNMDEKDRFLHMFEAITNWCYEGIDSIHHDTTFEICWYKNNNKFVYHVHADEGHVFQERLEVNYNAIIDVVDTTGRTLNCAEESSFRTQAWKWLVNNMIVVKDPTDDWYIAYEAQSEFLDKVFNNTTVDSSSVLHIADCLATGSLCIINNIEDAFSSQEIVDILMAFKCNKNGAKLICTLKNPMYTVMNVCRKQVIIADTGSNPVSKKMYKEIVTNEAGYICQIDSLFNYLTKFAQSEKY